MDASFPLNPPAVCSHCGAEVKRAQSPGAILEVDSECPDHGVVYRWRPYGDLTFEEVLVMKERESEQAERLDAQLTRADAPGEIQGPAEAVLEYLREWSGEDLTVDWADRMARAPIQQVRQLMEDWPYGVNGFLDRPAALAPIQDGTLRPVVSGWAGQDRMINSALRALLYTDSVVVESDVVDPFMDLRSEIEFGEPERREVRDALRRLVLLEPLIADGSVKFAGRWNVLGSADMLKFMRVLREVPAELWSTGSEDEVLSGRGTLSTLMAGCFHLVEARKATPFAQTRNEHIAIEALFAGHQIDGRLSELNTLSRIDVPDFHGDARALIELRKQSDAFSTWRSLLRAAIRDIDRLPDSETALKDAESVLWQSLRDGLEPIERQTARSPFTQALRAGSRRLSHAAITLGTGASLGTAMGQPVLGSLIGFAGGLAGNGAQTVGDFLTARRAARGNKAILDVAMVFAPGDTSAN